MEEGGDIFQDIILEMHHYQVKATMILLLGFYFKKRKKT
jgi:hypothetical protein